MMMADKHLNFESTHLKTVNQLSFNFGQINFYSITTEFEEIKSSKSNSYFRSIFDYLKSVKIEFNSIFDFDY